MGPLSLRSASRPDRPRLRLVAVWTTLTGLLAATAVTAGPAAAREAPWAPTLSHAVPAADPSAAPADPPAAFPPPADDPFYADPPRLASYAPGAIIRSRRIAAEIVDWGTNVPVSSWQVAYRSNNAQARPITSVTTILVPQAAWAGPGRRPMVAYQSAEDSTGSQCAPSYTLATNDGTLTGQEQAYLGQALEKGIVLALADHEGPQAAFLVGRQAAQIVLDGIRAAQHFGAAGLSSATPVGLWGLSGGAFDTAWAGELQRTYAPDLHLAGIAFGGAPANLTHSLNQLDGGPFVGFALGAMVGLSHGYPGWDLQSQLNAKGRQVYAAVDQKCTKDFVLTTAFTRLDDLTDQPDALSLPQNASLIARDSLGQRAPAAPVFDYYSLLDEAVPTADSLALIASYCGRGVPVVPDPILFSEHVTLGTLGAPDAVRFLVDRFSGVPLTGVCP